MLIGLYGVSRAGKDSIAKILYYNYGFEWRSFAAPLRAIMLKMDPYLPELNTTLSVAVERYGWDWTKEKSKASVEMMIDLGQSVRDLIHEDAWVWGALKDPLPKNLVISDVRQPNEYKKIKELGGEVWKVIRPGTTSRRMDHLLDDFDFDRVIHNSWTLDDLEDIVKNEMDI